MIQDTLPLPFDKIIPYRLLIQPSEVQMSGVLHESFHVFQVQEAPGRFDDAEEAYAVEDAYWSADEAMHEAWQAEIELLEGALTADSNAQAAVLADQFLEQREARRSAAGLSDELASKPGRGHAFLLHWHGPGQAPGSIAPKLERSDL